MRSVEIDSTCSPSGPSVMGLESVAETSSKFRDERRKLETPHGSCSVARRMKSSDDREGSRAVLTMRRNEMKWIGWMRRYLGKSFRRLSALFCKWNCSAVAARCYEVILFLVIGLLVESAIQSDELNSYKYDLTSYKSRFVRSSVSFSFFKQNITGLSGHFILQLFDFL